MNKLQAKEIKMTKADLIEFLKPVNDDEQIEIRSESGLDWVIVAMENKEDKTILRIK